MSERDLLLAKGRRYVYGAAEENQTKYGVAQLSRGQEGDAGLDLVVSERVVIRPGEFADVHSGVCVQLPPGYWGLLTGRSSTIRRRGLLVTQGVIDNGYRGELFAGVWNLSGSVAVVEVGERLAQLILVPQWTGTLAWTGALDGSARGVQGFGSSGS